MPDNWKSVFKNAKNPFSYKESGEVDMPTRRELNSVTAYFAKGGSNCVEEAKEIRDSMSYVAEANPAVFLNLFKAYNVNPPDRAVLGNLSNLLGRSVLEDMPVSLQEQHASQEASQRASQEASQRASQEASQRASQEASQRASQEASQRASQESYQESYQECCCCCVSADIYKGSLGLSVGPQLKLISGKAMLGAHLDFSFDKLNLGRESKVSCSLWHRKDKIKTTMKVETDFSEKGTESSVMIQGELPKGVFIGPRFVPRGPGLKALFSSFLKNKQIVLSRPMGAGTKKVCTDIEIGSLRSPPRTGKVNQHGKRRHKKQAEKNPLPNETREAKETQKGEKVLTQPTNFEPFVDQFATLVPAVETPIEPQPVVSRSARCRTQLMQPNPIPSYPKVPRGYSIIQDLTLCIGSGMLIGFVATKLWSFLKDED